MKVNIDRLYAGTVSQPTLEMYRKIWESYVKFAGSEDKALLPSTFAAWRDHFIHETEYARKTINARLGAIHSIMSYLYANGTIDLETRDGFKRTRILRQNMLRGRGKLRPRTRIEPEEMRRICDTPQAHPDNPRELFNRALVLVLATSGLRVSEAARIKANDIVMQAGFPMITNVTVKGGNVREAPLSQEAYEAVQDWLNFRPVHSEYVFNGFVVTDEDGLLWADKPAHRAYLLKQVKEVAERAGVSDVKTHDFRRFVGTQLARRDLRLAQKVLGHASIETTARHYVLDRIPAGVTEGIF